MEIGSIVWGAKDVNRAVAFWSRALGYQLKYPASEDCAILVPIHGNGSPMSLNKVSSVKAKRHHMDLFTDNHNEEVERLIALGETRAKCSYPPQADYIVLQDSDGNPFCVVQRWICIDKEKIYYD